MTVWCVGMILQPPKTRLFLPHNVTHAASHHMRFRAWPVLVDGRHGSTVSSEMVYRMFATTLVPALCWRKHSHNHAGQTFVTRYNIMRRASKCLPFVWHIGLLRDRDRQFSCQKQLSTLTIYVIAHYRPTYWQRTIRSVSAVLDWKIQCQNASWRTVSTLQPVPLSPFWC